LTHFAIFPLESFRAFADVGAAVDPAVTGDALAAVRTRRGKTKIEFDLTKGT
jgi:hypothetical protein